MISVSRTSRWDVSKEYKETNQYQIALDWLGRVATINNLCPDELAEHLFHLWLKRWHWSNPVPMSYIDGIISLLEQGMDAGDWRNHDCGGPNADGVCYIVQGYGTTKEDFGSMWHIVVHHIYAFHSSI